MTATTSIPKTLVAVPTVKTHKELPSLHGIRAIAAISVVLYHAGYSWASGGLAVTCFFVLSGFLITHLMLEEYERTGGINLRKFYIRRSLRIFPAFWVYCALVTVATLVVGGKLDWWLMIANVLYLANYYQALVLHHSGAPLLHISWSLAVEEQFYLLWPATLRKFFLGSRAIPMLCGIIGMIWIYRYVASIFFNAPFIYIFRSFETRADALLLGSLMAIAMHRGKIPRWMYTNLWPSLIALPFFLLVVLRLPGFQIKEFFSPICFAIIIFQSVHLSESWLFSWLNNKALAYIGGKLSYSMYIYHPIMVALTQNYSLPLRAVVCVAGAILLANGSYLLVEAPFLRLKDTLAGSKDRP